jgi:hypothetical protein
LDRDEPDSPSLLSQRPDVPEGRSSHPRVRRDASLVAMVAVLAAVGLLGFGLVFGGSGGSAGPSVSPVALASDGLPTQMDGQRVYLVSDKAEWQNLSGSFLLGAHAVLLPPGCSGSHWPAPTAPTATPNPAADDLVNGCGGVELAPGAVTDYVLGNLMAAPRGAGVLAGWSYAATAIVMRVHTHDAEAGQCAANEQAACQVAVVVESVVWPVVPTEIAGERVHRMGGVLGSFADLKGSFLFGGVVTVVDSGTCEAPSMSDAEVQLLGWCNQVSIDGLAISPNSNFKAVRNQVVVVRVHVNDPLAARCPPENQYLCERAVVVESVVWTSDPYGTASPPPAVASSTAGP